MVRAIHSAAVRVFSPPGHEVAETVYFLRALFQLCLEWFFLQTGSNVDRGQGAGVFSAARDERLWTPPIHSTKSTCLLLAERTSRGNTQPP